MSLRHYHHHHHHHHGVNAGDDNDNPLDEFKKTTKRAATTKKINNNKKSNNNNVMAAILVCLLGCFLCCVSTFQLLRGLTASSWTPPVPQPQPPPLSSLQRSDFPETKTVDHAAVAAGAGAGAAATESTSKSVRRKSKQQPASTAAATPCPTRTATATATYSSSPWVIFYNIYIRPNSTGQVLQGALGILEDQLYQVGSSYATSNNNSNTSNQTSSTIPVDLYYNTIGAPHLVHHSEKMSFFQNLCRRNHLNCIHLQHYDVAYESKTLYDVHRYCQRQAANTDRVVIYFHNKGSFHDSNALHETDSISNNNNDNTATTIVTEGAYSGQDSWRRAMTAAATSRQCLEPLTRTTILHDDETNTTNGADAVCDACGLLFQPLPYEHYPGNIWSARCSYIQQLVDPFTLRNKRSAMLQDLFQTSKQRRLFLFQKKQLLQQNRQATATTTAPLPSALLQANLFPLANAMTGGDRYLSEFWLGSHPWLRPCDVSKTISLQYWKDRPYPPPLQDNDVDLSMWELSYGPRRDIANTGWEYYKYMNPNTSDLLIMQDDANINRDMTNSGSSLLQQQRQYQEFFLLPGRLLKWMYIYNATPRQDSWMWSWFPHGQEWKRQIIGGVGTTTAAEAASYQHHLSSSSLMLTTTANTTATTTAVSNNSNRHHQNQNFQRFQQYYKHVTKQKSARS